MAREDPQRITGPAFGKPADLLWHATEGNTVRLAGTTTLAGRRAYVVDLERGPDSHLAYPDTVTGVRDWIDTQTYLLLGSAAYRADGTLETLWTFITLSINSPVNALQFQLTPPAGLVWPTAPPPTPTEIDVAAQLQREARSAPTPLFQPRWLPPWLDPEAYMWWPQMYGSYLALQYDSPRSPGALQITEGQASVFAHAEDGDPVDVGGISGRYREGGGTRFLTLTRDGTAIILEGKAEVTRDVLLEIAASLEQVDHPPRP
ncbi:MAG TPA: hypothetical protein VKY74_28500 [Chloroflexia bacterium]|nr:hypothetical protein [Chloroflexia bacterium]